jgi:hypothetical protein
MNRQSSLSFSWQYASRFVQAIFAYCRISKQLSCILFTKINAAVCSFYQDRFQVDVKGIVDNQTRAERVAEFLRQCHQHSIEDPIKVALARAALDEMAEWIAEAVQTGGLPEHQQAAVALTSELCGTEIRGLK